MMDGKMSTEMSDEQADVMLQQLLQLKTYEKPDPSRMTRNKQNIMRQVRQAQSEKRKPLLDRLEINIPWFFAEPKYGIAALFVAFFGLQYVGMTTRQSAMDTGVYTPTDHLAVYEQEDIPSSVISNRYPNLPSNYHLFSNPQGNQSVVPAGFEYKEQ